MTHSMAAYRSVEDMSVRLTQVIERAREGRFLRDAVLIAFHCIRGRFSLRKWRHTLQLLESDYEIKGQAASTLGVLIEKSASVWDEQARERFASSWALRAVVPLIDAYHRELEDLEETMVLASSERFSRFLRSSLGAS